MLPALSIWCRANRIAYGSYTEVLAGALVALEKEKSLDRKENANSGKVERALQIEPGFAQTSKGDCSAGIVSCM